MSPIHVWGYDPDHVEPSAAMISRSFNSVTNTSANTRGFLVAPRLSLAVAATDEFPQDVQSTFSATSVAVSTDCKVVKNCTWDEATDTVTGCGGVGGPINTTTPTIFGGPTYDQYGAIPNPFQFFYRFRMDVSMIAPSFIFDNPGTWYLRNGSVEIVTTCNTSVSDVSLTWAKLSYVIDNSTLSSGFAAGAIFGPTLQTVMPSYLAATIESMALDANVLADYETGLSNMLADGMVDRASPLLSPTDTTAASAFSPLLVTQYPILPLFTFILLLYIYAILVVSLLLAAILTRSSHIVVERLSGEPRRVPTLALAHRNIVNPLSTIAVMFAKDQDASVATGKDGHDVAAVHARASVAMAESKLFESSEKASTDPPRVVVGLREGTSTQPMFGLWLKGPQ
jgi:hypothetical protein